MEPPLAFAHAAHMENGLTCDRCHPGADRERHAGLVPVATCVGCHRRVVPDHPEVVKLFAAYDEGRELLWPRTGFLPSRAMVRFHHGAHVEAEVECAECHGAVEEMTIAEPVRELADMGWCVDCHRSRAADDDCLVCHR